MRLTLRLWLSKALSPALARVGSLLIVARILSNGLALFPSIQSGTQRRPLLPPSASKIGKAGLNGIGS